MRGTDLMESRLDSPWERYLRPVVATVAEVLQPSLIIHSLFARKVIHLADYESIVCDKATLAETVKASFLLGKLMRKGTEEFKTFLA